MNTYKGHRNGKRRESGRSTASGRVKGKSRRKAAVFVENTYIKWGILILAVLTLALAVRGFLSHGGTYVNVDASERISMYSFSTSILIHGRESRAMELQGS